MFFQYSPPAAKVRALKVTPEEESPSVISLAPFTPSAKIYFDKVPVKTTVSRWLRIQNPTAQNIELHIIKVPAEERGVAFSWESVLIPANGEEVLEIQWKPEKEGSWTDSVSFDGGKRIRKDVQIILKSIKTNKTRKSPIKKVVVKRIKSPTKKFVSPKSSPKTRKNVSNKDKENSFQFHSPSSMSFNLDVKQIEFKGRETYCVNNLVPKITEHNVDNCEFNDSLETEKNSPIKSLRDCTNLNDLQGNKLSISRFNDIQFTPKTQNTALDNIFNPSLCSTGEKSVTFNNLSSETFNKSERFKGNISTETYTKHLDNDFSTLGNISSSTYLLNNSHCQKENMFCPNNQDNQDNFLKPKEYTGNSNNTFNRDTIEKQRFLLSPTVDLKKNSLSYSANFDCKGNSLKFGNNSPKFDDIRSNFTGNSPNCSKNSPKFTENKYLLKNSPTSIYKGNRLQFDDKSPNFPRNSPTLTRNSPNCFKNSPNSPNFQGKSPNYPNYGEKSPNCRDNSLNCSRKRKSTTCFKISPAKKIQSKENWSKVGVVRKVGQQKIKGLNLKEVIEQSRREQTMVREIEKSVVLHDPNSFLSSIQNPLLLATTNQIDPFLNATLFYDPQWMDAQQVSFTRWLNALLTPHRDFETNTEGVDVAKLWQQATMKQQTNKTIKTNSSNNKKQQTSSATITSNNTVQEQQVAKIMSSSKESATVSITKEHISEQYHVSGRLESLRKQAIELFRNSEISSVLSKVSGLVENGKIEVRKDRNVHLDLSLQYEVIYLLLSYNTLWLRVGLEMIFGVTVPLTSNSDSLGITQFIVERLFKDAYLLKKYKSVHTVKYTIDIKKHVLKKFLMLVYYLDQAKLRKLIAHDPCLFVKRAEFKESREILLRFSREIVASIGDICRVLKFTGYTLSYQQGFINEFEYPVSNLGVDLRDGVRLARVMEIILLVNDLTGKMRVPAISLLQKVFNVKVSFDALEEAGFKILESVTPKDIVDGHKEKTLSFLWQIVHKFQAPRFTKAVISVQHWWRSMSVVLIRNKRARNARKIQRWYKSHLYADRILARVAEIRKELIRLQELKILNQRNCAATKIQSVIRMFLQKRKFVTFKRSTIILQSHFRMILAKKVFKQRKAAVVTIQTFVRGFICLNNYRQLKTAAVFVQRRYLANSAMRLARNHFERLKCAVILIQRCFRAKIARTCYVHRRNAVLIIQRKFRAIREGRIARENFLALKHVTILMQLRFRANSAMKLQRTAFLQQKNAVIVIENRFLALKSMKLTCGIYNKWRKSVIFVQHKFRAKLAMKRQLEEFTKLKRSVLFVQRRFRANISMITCRYRFKLQKDAVVFLQNKFRAVVLMRIQRQEYLELRNAVLITQSKFRANILMKKHRDYYQQLQSSVKIVQAKYRANKLMKLQKNNYQIVKNAVITLQSRYKAQVLMKKQRNEYLNLQKSTLLVQRFYRAYKLKVAERKHFIQLKKVVLFVQEQYRAKLLMKTAQNNYKILLNTVTKVQRRFRTNKAMQTARNNYQLLLKSTAKIQIQFRAYKAMKIQKEKYLMLRKYVLKVQELYRARLLMKIEKQKYQSLRNVVIFVQGKYRANLAMKKANLEYKTLRNSVLKVQRVYRANTLCKTARIDYQKLRESSVIVQRRFKANKARRIAFSNFQNLKKSVITVQRTFRANLAMKKAKLSYDTLKNCVVNIQRRFRANKLAKTTRNDFTNLKARTIFIQRKFRANKARENAMNYYRNLKKNVVFVQRKFRANLAMKKALNEYTTLKNTVIMIQRRFRANKLTKTTRNNFVNLKARSIFIQRTYKANKAMKRQLDYYQNFKKSTIFIQRKFRANLAMKKALTDYTTLKNTVIMVQKRLRANKLAKTTRKHFVNLKARSIFIQRTYKANKAMQHQLDYYKNLKKNCIYIQRKFRANLAMKKAFTDYTTLKNTVTMVQRQFRANKLAKFARKTFVNLKAKSIFIQRTYKANKAMKFELDYYQNLKKSSIYIQRKFRANLAMQKASTDYAILKNIVIMIQRQFRANKLAKTTRSSFIKLKTSTILVQRQFKANKAMKISLTNYQNLKKNTIYIQRKFRANLAMKKASTDYTILKNTVIMIQRKFRANKLAKITRNNFIELKTSTVFIQRRFNANKAMKVAFTNYQNLKKAVKYTEDILLAKLLMQLHRHSYLLLKGLIIGLQTHARGYLARKKHSYIYNAEYRRQRKEEQIRYRASVKIQAWFRGCRVRMGRREEVVEIRKRKESMKRDSIKSGKGEGTTQATLGERRDRAIQHLSCEGNSLLQVLTALKDLEYITRRCPVTCQRFAPVLPGSLFTLIASSSRSEPERKSLVHAVGILVNLYRASPHTPELFPVDTTLPITAVATTSTSSGIPTSSNTTLTMRPSSMSISLSTSSVIAPSNTTSSLKLLDRLASVMSFWCDKDCDVMVLLATLFWLWSQRAEYRVVVVQLPSLRQRLAKMETLINRKIGMVTRTQSRSNTVTSVLQNRVFITTTSQRQYFPSQTADWGLAYEHRPRAFSNALFALKSLQEILDEDK